MGGQDTDQAFAGSITRYLVGFLDDLGSAALVDAVKLAAGEHRPTDALLDETAWHTYDEVRALYEAAATALGGPEALRALGGHLWQATIGTPGMTEGLMALGGPEGLLGLLDAVAARITTVVEHTSAESAPHDWEATVRFHDGFEPFEAYCNFAAGLLAQIPPIYGMPAADVEETACARDGADACHFRIRWEADASGFDAMRLRVLEARLSSLESMVGDLISGERLEVVLDRVVSSASRAVQAMGVVLSVQLPGEAEPRLHWRGLTETVARQLAALPDGESPADRTFLAETVASSQRAYGRLCLVHDATARFLRHEVLLMRAFARLAAAALDSAFALEEAARQAATASTLLDLASELAEPGTTEEVAQRLAAAVPAVIDCDRAAVLLVDHETAEARIVATCGYDDEQRARAAMQVFRADPSLPGYDDLIVVDFDDLLPEDRAQVRDTAAMATVPMRAGGDLVGFVSALVNTDAQRLFTDEHVGVRLRGVAAQGATAIRNAQLVDRIRYQALHDPLTGLANLRLVEELAVAAIAQARRAGEGVAMLFLDVDRFKRINDTYGHGAGDELLRAVADRVRAQLREGDAVGRIGGDEFVVLLPRLSDGPEAAVAKLDAALAGQYELDTVTVEASVSIGWAEFPDDGDDVETLLKLADTRMYAAKLARRRAAS